MHVCIVARGVPSERTPLWGIFELDQARALAAAGHRVSLAALDIRSLRRLRRPGYRRESIDGVEVHHLSIPLGQAPLAVESPLLDAGLALLLRRIERADGPIDVLHAHFTKYAAAAARAGHRAPLVVTEHRSKFTPDGEVPPHLMTLGRQAYPAADRVVTVSTALADVLHSRFGVDPVVVPNIVDAATFASLPFEPHEGVRLVSVGNLLPRKRMVLLLDAFAAAFADRPEVSLTIIGDGPDRAALEARIAEAGLAERVRLPGRRTRAQIAPEMVRADGFCLLSSYETFGVAYIEAMAAGLPVLASRCGGPDDFVTDANGRFTDATDVDGVAAALTRFVAELPSFDRAAIRAEAARRFSPETVAAQLGEVYHAVTA